MIIMIIKNPNASGCCASRAAGLDRWNNLSTELAVFSRALPRNCLGPRPVGPAGRAVESISGWRNGNRTLVGGRMGFIKLVGEFLGQQI